MPPSSARPEVGEHRQNAAVVVGRVTETELLEDLPDVRFAGLLAQEQPRTDRLVRMAFGDQAEDLPFALSELAQRARLARSRDQPLDDRRVEDAFAVGDPPERVDEDRDVRDALLEQVADRFRMVR